MDYSKIIKELGKNRVKLDELMANHTTFKIGGPADLFYEAKTEEELTRVIRLSRKIGVPYFLLGGGSNILFSDRGFRGLVIKNCVAGCKLLNEEEVEVASGTPNGILIRWAVERGLSGVEFLVGIPGTIGGAIRGNSGAWSQSIGKRVSRVKVLTDNGEVRWIRGLECQFNYRHSRFKKSREVILRVELNLEVGNKKEIREKINEYVKKRKKDPKGPSAGCIFVNPKPDSTGRLIDSCGLKGKRIGKAQISPKHANFIVNLGGATCQDVLKLIALAKKTVKNKFEIELEEEIEIVGEI